jgi:hypothetical protein
MGRPRVQGLRAGAWFASGARELGAPLGVCRAWLDYRAVQTLIFVAKFRQLVHPLIE